MMLEERPDKIDCWNIQMWLEDEKSFDGGRITVKGDYAIDPSSYALRFESHLEQPKFTNGRLSKNKGLARNNDLQTQRAFFKEVYMWTSYKENKAKLKIFAQRPKHGCPKT